MGMLMTPSTTKMSYLATAAQTVLTMIPSLSLLTPMRTAAILLLALASTASACIPLLRARRAHLLRPPIIILMHRSASRKGIKGGRGMAQHHTQPRLLLVRINSPALTLATPSRP